jgi:Domain of unknown function (DUF4602)
MAPAREKPAARRPVLVVEAPNFYSAAQKNATGPSMTKAQRKALRDSEEAAEQELKDKQRGKKRQRTNADEYKDIWNSVTAVGAAQFTGRQKREHEAEKIVAMGGQAPKNKKVPYKILQGIKAKHKKREARAVELEQESGVVSGYSAMQQQKKRSRAAAVQSSTQRNRDSNKSGAFRSKHVDQGPAPSNGFVKNGLLRVHNAPASSSKRKASPSKR